MTSRSIFNAKASSIPYQAIFEFGTDLPFGETLSSATITAAVYSGVDATPAALISGSASTAGSQASQVIVDGVIGVTYLLTATATTSAGHTLVRQGLLCVTEA